MRTVNWVSARVGENASQGSRKGAADIQGNGRQPDEPRETQTAKEGAASELDEGSKGITRIS